MALYFTGDTHANMDRFSMENFPHQADMTKDDYMVICGDFGGVWDNSTRQKELLDDLDAKSYTTLFVSGNHENFDLLEEYPVEQWHGGNVHFIRSSVIHLMRGQVFDLCGKTVFTMGGASSHDIQDGILDPFDPLFEQKYRILCRRNAWFRIDHVSWWKQELPSEKEYQTARDNLDKAGRKVDYIVTHCAPSIVQPDIGGLSYKTDALTDFLDEVYQTCQFDKWFFGHYHKDEWPRENMRLLYHDIIRC